MKFLVGLSIVIVLFAVEIKSVSAQSLDLVGNKVATFIDDSNNPARLFRVVEAAFPEQQITLTATTQAWSGSGLKSGKFQGYVDHYSLDNQKNNFVYSQPYVQIQLHVASLDNAAGTINRLDQLFDERIGIEKRFANTDRMRQVRDVKWARASSHYENIKQLSQQRVDFILADLVMLQEMNKLLAAINEDPLVISPSPIFTVDVRLGINQNLEQAGVIVANFNRAIEQLTASEKLNKLYQSQPGVDSLLDASLYADILRKW